MEDKTEADYVTAYGHGLKGGLVGSDIVFFVNTQYAGDGALGLSVDGPSHAHIQCEEQPDGTYKVKFVADSCGIYGISIRFDGDHIPSSPYSSEVVETKNKLLDIVGEASRCTTRGSGLNYAQLGEEAFFTVDASEAGHGCLMVGIDSSYEPMRKSVIKHIGDNIYRVSYILEEIGDYKLKVLWADEHIPGSPFSIQVLP